jgi:hypothetical protein
VELAQSLRHKGGINISHAALLKVFAEHLVSGMVHNHPARVGKCKQEALGASTVTQGATKRCLVEHVQHQQLDYDLDKDLAIAVASSSTIIVDVPLVINSGVTDSHPCLHHMIRIIIWILTCQNSSVLEL